MNTVTVIGNIMMLVCSASTGSAGAAEPSVDAGAYITAVVVAREAWNAGGSKEKAAESAARLAKLGLKRGDPGYSVLEYVRCRLLVLASFRVEAEEGLLELVGSRSVAAEALLGVLELNGEDKAKVMALRACMGELLPMSVWPVLARTGQSKIVRLVNPAPPVIPRFDERAATVIPKEFEQAGLCDLAWKAYVEAVYFVLPPAWIADPPGENWCSPDAGELWFSAAKNAWEAGQHQLAYEYLAKAAIFGHEPQLNKAKELLAEWKNGLVDERREISEEQKQAAIEEVARLYSQLNAHPRALEVIQAQAEVLERPDELYEEYASEWKAIVGRYRTLVENVVLYGIEISSTDDPAAMRIPFPCSQEAVSKVKAKVRLIVRGSSGRSETQEPPLGK